MFINIWDDRNYKSSEELAEFAKDVDVWIYPGHGTYYWDTAYADFKEQLDTIPAVQKKQVYDTVLTDLNTWYEHRLMEYDLVLEDMCNLVGAGHPLLPHQRGFLRNVFEEEVGSLGTCPDLDQEFVFRAEECISVVELINEQSAASSWTGLGATIFAVWMSFFWWN